MHGPVCLHPRRPSVSRPCRLLQGAVEEAARHNARQLTESGVAVQSGPAAVASRRRQEGEAAGGGEGGGDLSRSEFDDLVKGGVAGLGPGIGLRGRGGEREVAERLARMLMKRMAVAEVLGRLEDSSYTHADLGPVCVLLQMAAMVSSRRTSSPLDRSPCTLPRPVGASSPLSLYYTPSYRQPPCSPLPPLSMLPTVPELLPLRLHFLVFPSFPRPSLVARRFNSPILPRPPCLSLPPSSGSPAVPSPRNALRPPPPPSLTPVWCQTFSESHGLRDAF